MTNLPHPPPTFRTIDRLDLDDLATGKKTRLMIELAQDGLGQSVAVPVIVARGQKDGPTFGLTAAVHGNELNGIPVIHRLLDRLDLQRLRGTVVAIVVVNVPGVLRNQRTFADGKDLNHIMPGRGNGNEAEVYTHRLVDRVIRHFDYLIDLHTASFGRINSFYIRADMDNEVTRKMALLQRPQIILHDPPSDHTLRGAAEDMNIPAVTVEMRDPQRFQRDVIRRTVQGVRGVLGELGMLKKSRAQAIESPIICKDSRWLYTDRGGLLEVLPDVADVVDEGAEVARLTNAFGDVIRQYRAPHRGVVIGKSSNPVSPTGARILHLGEIAD